MKSVLVTGGTGSFGNSFIRRLLRTGVERVAVYSRGEHAQEDMFRAITDNRLRFFIGDVRDRDRLELAMRGIDTVIHAAALKIVPIAEYNPTECIATNIGGAENVVKAAIRSGVTRVIALSTDKAVNPVNLYGASKLAAEKIFIAANALSAGDCAFSVVRYGNVVGSRGSVLPLFKKLAAQGKSLPITDRRMTRFWITLDQAIDLVMNAHKTMRGREVYIPKIPSIKITDLAEAFGCETFHIGIRPGEKIHEVLITEDESGLCLELDNHYIISPHSMAEVDGTPMTMKRQRYSSDTNTQWLTIEQLKESLYEKAEA